MNYSPLSSTRRASAAHPSTHTGRLAACAGQPGTTGSVRRLATRPSRRTRGRAPPALRGLPESSITAGDVVEGYVASEDRDVLVEDYLLSPAPRSRANVIFHLVPASSEHPALATLGQIAGSSLAIAADLAEHDGVREKNEAHRFLSPLGNAFPPASGSDRG